MAIFKNIYLSLFCFSVVSYLNGFLAVNVYDPETAYPPLVDYGFKYLPQIPAEIPNAMLSLFCIYFLVKYCRWENEKQLGKVLWCITILFALRMFTFTVTIVPPATLGCQGRTETGSFIWEIVRYLHVNGDNTCVDYMFSGHVTYFITLYAYIYNYSKSMNEKIFFTFYVIIGTFAVISAHIHYTVDVIMAIVLATITCNYVMNNVWEEMDWGSRPRDRKTKCRIDL